MSSEDFVSAFASVFVSKEPEVPEIIQPVNTVMREVNLSTEVVNKTLLKLDVTSSC